MPIETNKNTLVVLNMVIDLLSEERELRRLFLSFLPQTA
jgi:hypothetical protein